MFLSLMSRPDTQAEFSEGILVDILFTGPLWAIHTYLRLRDASSRDGQRRNRTLLLSLLAYFVVVSSLTTVAILKQHLRTHTACECPCDDRK